MAAGYLDEKKSMEGSTSDQSNSTSTSNKKPKDNYKQRVDSKFYLDEIEKGKKRREREYVEAFNHNYALYNSKASPRTGPYTSGVNQYNYVNEVYSDIEIQRASLGYRNPRILTTPNKPKFIFKKARGNRNFIKGGIDLEVIKIMEDNNVDRAPNPLNPEETFYVLDGLKSSRTSESILNDEFREQQIDGLIDRTKLDALVAGMGAVWEQYKDNNSLSYYLDIDISEGRSVTEPLNLCSDIIFDNNLRSPDQLDNSKRLFRRYFFTVEELKELSFFFDEKVIEEIFDNAEQMVVDFEDGAEAKNKTRKAEAKDSEKLKGYEIWECWEKPTLGQSRTRKQGKIRYFCQGVDKELKCNKWDSYAEGFPIVLLYFNASNDRLYPISDIQQYEPLLAEKAEIRGYMRKFMKRLSDIIIVGDKQKLDQDTIQKFIQGDHFVGVDDYKAKDFDQFQIASPSGEFFAMDRKIDEDKQKVSLISNAQKSIASTSRVSATEVAVNDRATASRLGLRQNALALFIQKIARKKLQNMQQYYDTPRIVRMAGTTDISWTDEFTREHIQGDYRISIDVMSLNPIDEQTLRNDLVEFLNTIRPFAENPLLYKKILADGHDINMAEVFGEIVRRYKVENTKVYPPVDSRVQPLAEIAVMQDLGIVMPAAPTPGGPGPTGGTPGPNAAPQEGSPVFTQSNPVSQPGETASPGGDIKLS